MAYYDRFEAAKKEHAAEMYEKLTLHLASPYPDPLNGGELIRHPYYDALSHLSAINVELEHLRAQIKEYNNFFTTLSKFLPKTTFTPNVYG